MTPKTVLSVQVDDIESVVEWYTRIHDGTVVIRSETTATIEFPTKIVNYVEYGEMEQETVWEETLVAVDEIEEETEVEVYTSEMSVEDFFTKGNSDE